MQEDVEFFENNGFHLAYRQTAKKIGDPILLIHGFASSSYINWVSTGWFDLLADAGYHVIAIDNRGHGLSTKSHQYEDYYPESMADDAAALLEHMNIEKAHIMGYSMGARISAYLALQVPEKIQSIVFAGMGSAMFKDPGDWRSVHDALLADDPSDIADERGRLFRKFADNTKSDCRALASCIKTSKKELTKEQLHKIKAPALVAVGSKDKIGGDPLALAQLLPHGEAYIIPDRDHMLAVGDKNYKQHTLEFINKYQI